MRERETLHQQHLKATANDYIERGRKKRFVHTFESRTYVDTSLSAVRGREARSLWYSWDLKLCGVLSSVLLPRVYSSFPRLYTSIDWLRWLLHQAAQRQNENEEEKKRVEKERKKKMLEREPGSKSNNI